MTTLRPLPSLARTAAAVAVVAASAGSLTAQSQRTLFAWSGRVDRDVLLVMRGGRVDTRSVTGLGVDRGNVRVNTDLPQTDGAVDVRLSRGRGSAEVVQQPGARNDYTTIVRLRDDAAGADDYQVTTYWQPVNGSNAGGYGRDDNTGRDNTGRDNDGRDDRRGDAGGRREDRRDRQDRRGRGWGWGRRDRDRRDGETGDRDDSRTSGRGNGGWGNGGSGNGGRGDTGGTSGTLRWSGRVDDVEEIRIRGRRASTRTVSGGGAADVRTSVSGGGLPERGGTVRLRTFDGRGSVRVIEQPNARNGYTAVLRVEDRDRGAGFYDFEASWY